MIPQVTGRDAFTALKSGGAAYAPPVAFEDIEIPKNTAFGAILTMAGTAGGLALVWHAWWLVVLSAAAILAFWIAASFRKESRVTIPAATVAARHRDWLREVEAAPATTRDEETSPRNAGRAAPDAQQVPA